MRLQAKWALALSQDVSYRPATPNGCSRARFETDTGQKRAVRLILRRTLKRLLPSKTRRM